MCPYCMCMFVCWDTTFKCHGIEAIFGMVGRLNHIQVRYEYQGYWVKVKLILLTWVFELLVPNSFVVTNL